MAVVKSNLLDVVALGETPKRTILKLAAPTVVAMLLQSLVNEIDIIFFKSLPGCDGSNAQAALSPSLIILWLFGGSLSAISVGTQAITARRYAERDPKSAGMVLTNCLAFCIGSSVVMTGVALLMMRFLLARMIKVPEALEVAVSYSSFRVFGILSMCTTIGIKSFFDGIGKTQIHFIASFVMNIFNVLFCYAFIFGKFGFPVMGASGAGLGALLSTYIGLAIMAWYLVKHREDYDPFKVSNLSKSMLWDLVKLSAPAGLATIIMMGGFSVFVSFAGKLDNALPIIAGAASCGRHEAVNGAATTNIIGLMKLTFTACIAFGTATATLVGQSMGAKRPDLASKFGWASVRLGLVVFGVVGLVEGVLATGPIVNFITESEPVRMAMMDSLRIMGIVTPVIAVAMILSEALFGAGSTKFVGLAQLVLVFGVLIPSAWVLSLKFNLGLAGMWGGAALYALCAAVTMALRFRGGKWKQIQL
jgi:multidrug resistance protein, MATE family